MAENGVAFTKFSPLHPRMIALFTGIFTICLLAIEYFNIKENLQWLQIQTNYRGELVLGIITLKVWFIASLFIGIIIPVVLIIVSKFKPLANKILLPLIAVLFIQIAIEMIFSRRIFAGITIITGFFYTIFRIWQLQSAIKLFRYFSIKDQVNKLTYNYLIAACNFWALNLLFLLTILMKIPAI